MHAPQAGSRLGKADQEAVYDKLARQFDLLGLGEFGNIANLERSGSPRQIEHCAAMILPRRRQGLGELQRHGIIRRRRVAEIADVAAEVLYQGSMI